MYHVLLVDCLLACLPKVIIQAPFNEVLPDYLLLIQLSPLELDGLAPLQELPVAVSDFIPLLFNYKDMNNGCEETSAPMCLLCR